MSRKTGMTKLIHFCESNIVCTGGVVFIGDGKTGKTHSALNLTSFKGENFLGLENSGLKKSINIEFNYFIFQSNIEEFQVTTSSQLFIMPGQKGRAKVGEGLAFEDAVDLYYEIATVNDVLALILTYNSTDLSTFQELEYWLNRAIERKLVQECTSIILLGTHLDVESEGKISEQDIENAKGFIQSHIQKNTGIQLQEDRISSVQVSNMTGEGIEELKAYINKAFLIAFDLEQLVQNR